MSRTILIVGNSDGIGAAITRALLARGDRVVGVSRSPSPLGPSGPRHEIHDVASPTTSELVRRLARDVGGFDACIYCVGIGSALALPDLSSEARVFEVNLVGAVRTLEALVPDWIARRAGHFVGLSSLAGELYVADAPSYSASKAGLSNYLVSMGLKLRPQGVAVTNVRFGFVDTKMAKARVRPLMITREQAAVRVVRCLDTRPLQCTAPKLVGAAVACLGLAQAVRVWTSRSG